MQKNLKFVSFQEGTSKKGKPYRFITLSDGLEARLFSVSKEFSSEDLGELEKGEDVLVTMSGDPFAYMGGWVVTDLVPA